MTDSFPVPAGERRFEDYRPGAVYEFGPRRVEQAEIVEFATRYDPQAMHVDPAFAANGPYGGLIASGWHTASMTMRLLVDHYLPTTASLGSPGLEALSWPAPVRPGDELTVRASVAEARRSRSKPDRGVLHTLIETRTAAGVLVLQLTAINFVLIRT
jgi:acyl dehydratase